MTINEVIEDVRRIKTGFDLDDRRIIGSINYVEMKLLKDVIRGREGEDEYRSRGNYSSGTERDAVLIAPAPFDSMYIDYCCAIIDREQEETELYENDIIAYNMQFAAFKNYWWRTHRQAQKYRYHGG